MLNANGCYFQITPNVNFHILKTLPDSPGETGNLRWNYQVVMRSPIYKMNLYWLSRQAGETQSIVPRVYVCAFEPGSNVVNPNQNETIGIRTQTIL